MPMIVPTLDDVENWFRELVSEATRCTGEMDRREFERFRASVLHHDWEMISDAGAGWPSYGIRRVPIDQSIFLIRAAMEIVVQRHVDFQGGQIKDNIRSFLQPLVNLNPSKATLSFKFERPERNGPGDRIECMVEGIVVSSTATN